MQHVYNLSWSMVVFVRCNQGIRKVKSRSGVCVFFKISVTSKYVINLIIRTNIRTCTKSSSRSFSYPEPILRAVNGARQGALAKSISNWLLIGHNEIYGMNKNTQALHEALVSLWRKLGEKTLLMLKEQQYEAVRKIVVDNRPQKR